MGRFRIARVKIDVCDVGLKMAFRNFIYTEDDEDLSFLPKELSPGFGIGSSSVSVNMEPLKADEKLVIQPIEVTADSRESPKLELFDSFTQEVTCSTSSSKDDIPYLTVSDDDEGLPNVLELKDATAFHLKISAITPHNLSYELLQVIVKLRGEFDVMKDREKAREEECDELRVKCEAAMTEFEKNPTVMALREKISTFSTEVEEHKVSLDRMMLESQKWSGY
ncbi:hypothetical protein Tco_0186428 [Tanacetum coccineum]